ncbi:RelA/SpoT domain-containing protein [Ochrobactrum sp. AN78]|uniref:RelA/SpoT domain-containing protein n=1 Tax=Ochrobactrum sp. AN78 TaxID=3039853 RepID=UPI002989D47D|nr:RelA/SpoT domain-containing protein [Ochrobactrum sp. AN78]MDH7789146.1 ppGpp synthetase/RelA/SpoT-type nucleotidyltransferase [Ochrobactrum sp. AN78]
MAYEKPKMSMNQLDKFCKSMFAEECHIDDFQQAINHLFNWRSAHGYPLNALSMTLKNRVRSIDKNAIVAQRLKRLDSILRKLRRRSSMQMSQMQDVGGCRAILSGPRQLRQLMALYTEKPLNHSLTKIDNYISHPKEDGYRSIHMRYRFKGRASASPWDRLRIEIQIRTKLQHSWATAVETVDAFTGENLKFGNGSENWKRFFSLVSSVHAVYENCPTVPGTPNDIKELHAELLHLTNELNVIYKLRSYAQITKHMQGYKKGKDYWYLLELRPDENRILFKSYPSQLSRAARIEYASIEEKFSKTTNQAVLVSVDSLTDLQNAYPNFFGDTRLFISSLERFLEQNMN